MCPHGSPTFLLPGRQSGKLSRPHDVLCSMYQRCAGLWTRPAYVQHSLSKRWRTMVVLHSTHCRHHATVRHLGGIRRDGEHSAGLHRVCRESSDLRRKVSLSPALRVQNLTLQQVMLSLECFGKHYMFIQTTQNLSYLLGISFTRYFLLLESLLRSQTIEQHNSLDKPPYQPARVRP